MSIKKKLYTQAYFLIRSNEAYEHSFNIRLKYVGLNTMILGFAFGTLFLANRRAKAAKGENFE